MKKYNISINHEIESHCIPIKEVIKAFNFMEYGSEVRVMCEMLFLSGCRLSELDKMYFTPSNLPYLYWFVGKNQKGQARKVKLPEEYIEELKYYRATHRVSKKLFGINEDTLRRYFNRDIRPYIGKEWMEVRPVFTRNKRSYEYIFQLKGFRKDHSTLKFFKEIQKWKSAEVALEFTCKEMKHSSKQMTAYHYLESFEALGVSNYGHLTPAQIIKQAEHQKCLLDF